MLVLKIIDGPDKGKRFDVPDWEPQLIGRSSEALKISDQTCSRRHAELTPDDGEWYVRDLGSANGTYVNGRRIGSNRVRLQLGDLIRAGSTVFAFGARRYGGVNNPVRALQDEFMDAIVEQRFESNDDSMIMAVPDPAAAAQEHLRIIYELTRITTQTVDRESLLEFVMELIFDEFEPERGFILIQERPDEKPEPTVVKYRTPPRSQDEGQIHVSRTIVAHVMSRGEGVLSSNAMKDRRFSSGDSVRNYAIRSAICVPIRYHDHTYGVIHIDTSLKNYTFSDSQLRLLTAIGQHVGLALSNLALYEQQLQGARLAAVGETVASLSHSIKNILQGLRGGADVVGRALKKKDLGLAEGGWDILSRNLDRIYALTMNMLTYSKQRQVEIEMTKLSMLLQDVVALVQPQCDRRGIVLMTDYDPDMPPIPLDPGMMHQALMNLLINSIEAVEPTTGVITLRCDYDMVDDAVLIHISDNGPGIPESEQSRIWLPFHSTKGLRGTGLGLAVTRKIVEEHGGQISFESTEGEGATFTIRLSTDAAGVLDPSETLSTAAGAPAAPVNPGRQNEERAEPPGETAAPRTPFDPD
ncbi:MAG: FHA domain-containing protein [Phycisphaerales bacterium]|nr:FHA domain-containing protein [Phycisphaerales bacterium]